MAGNIIHAIATTNATIAGMIVVEALKIISSMPDKCKVTFSPLYRSQYAIHEPE